MIDQDDLMSPGRIIAELVLDMFVALLLFATGYVVWVAIVSVLPVGYSWLTLTLNYLTMSPIAFYARWRGHISFFNSDVFVFLPAPLLYSLSFKMLLNLGLLMTVIPAVMLAVLNVLFKFRQGIHRRPEDTEWERLRHQPHDEPII